MKSFVLIGILVAGPAVAAHVGVSVSVGEPGFFGQLNLGDVPQPPALIYSRPMVIHRDSAFGDVPIYLHVPPGYERHWARHCAEYHACGRPVYFVRDDWYNRVYVPRHRHDDGDRGHDRDHGERDRDHADHDHDHDHDHN